MATDELVVREVTPEIWTFSKPFTRFGFLPWGGRSTAIKVSTGNVWVLASTPLTEETKTTIDKLGTVNWLIGPDSVHYLYLDEYKKAYPEAKVIGVKDLAEKVKAKGLQLDGAYGIDPVDTKYGFEDEIKACYFSGFANQDVAFLHVASKTLIEADLLFNLPAKEQYSKSKSSSKVPIIGGIDPFGGLHKRFVSTQAKDVSAMRQDAKTVASWDFERIIPCHGDVIEGNGHEAWVAAYSKYLDE